MLDAKEFLALTGALIVTLCYYIYIQATFPDFHSVLH